MRITREKVYFHVPYRVLLDNLDTITEKQINCEIYVDGNALDTYTQAEVDRINSVFEKHGLSKIAHGPFYDLNPGSRDPKARELTNRRFTAAIEFCKKIKANYIVFHSGFQPIFYRETSGLFLDLSVEVWKDVLNIAVKDNIVISIENSIEPTPEIIIKLVARMNSPNFKACFDVGHFNAFGEKSIFDCLKEYPVGSISELHLSDNKGNFDTHLALGEGQIDFVRFFKEIDKMGIEPIVTSEPHSKEDIEKNLKFLLALGV